MENDDLRHQLDNMSSSMEALSVNTSTVSKTSKYPDVECPHFKNGGKCKNCIKAWKQKQKAKNEEPI